MHWNKNQKLAIAVGSSEMSSSCLTKVLDSWLSSQAPNLSSFQNWLKGKYKTLFSSPFDASTVTVTVCNSSIGFPSHLSRLSSAILVQY